MCGITGAMYFEDREPSQTMLKAMTDCMVHRGPNDFGFWGENRIGLGFRRLSVIDLKEGHQPLSNEDDTVWIVFNGEIYNYKYLRSSLQEKGHVFKTHSDTEVIVHMYEEFGEECVKHLRGMFGFVIWDRKRSVYLERVIILGSSPFIISRTAGSFCLDRKLKACWLQAAWTARYIQKACSII